jgi:hypothetical protein
MSLKIVDLGGEPISFVSQFSDHPEQGIERDKVHVEEGGCAFCGVGGVNLANEHVRLLCDAATDLVVRLGHAAESSALSDAPISN